MARFLYAEWPQLLAKLAWGATLVLAVLTFTHLRERAALSGVTASCPIPFLNLAAGPDPSQLGVSQDTATFCR